MVLEYLVVEQCIQASNYKKNALKYDQEGGRLHPFPLLQKSQVNTQGDRIFKKKSYSPKKSPSSKLGERGDWWQDDKF